MLTGPEKAVVFLLSLDEKIAAPIVAELTEDELRKLRTVASTMHEVNADAVDATYRDFVQRSSKAVAVPRGGLPYLRRLAVKAIGEERARNVFEDGTTSPMARLVKQPSPAPSLPCSPSRRSSQHDPRSHRARRRAAVLAAMPPKRQAIVMCRVSRLTGCLRAPRRSGRCAAAGCRPATAPRPWASTAWPAPPPS
jgi:flagellar motor switch protein FliG